MHPDVDEVSGTMSEDISEVGRDHTARLQSASKVREPAKDDDDFVTLDNEQSVFREDFR